ncbi:MAG: sugar ABC transporter substrate-binding protein [Eubacteriales bacterium]
MKLGKKMFVTTACSLSLVGLFACSSTDTTTPSTDSPSINPDASPDAQLLTFWMPEGGVAENELYAKLESDFNSENTEIQIELITIPRGNGYEYENKINSAATTQDLPDAIMMDGPSVANYVHAGLITPIGQYFSTDELSDFVPSTIQQGTVNGELYALAPTESTVGLYCNADVFEAAGISIPDKLEDAWTWEEVYEIAKTLQTDEMFGINLTWDDGEGQIYGLSPIVLSNGVQLLDDTGTIANGYINSPEAVEALTLYQKFATEGIMNLQALTDEFANGGAAMFLMGSWEYSNLVNNFPDFNFEITYYPTTNADVGVVSPAGDWAWGITSQSSNPEAAAEVMKYLTSAETVEAYTHAAQKPASRSSVLENQDMHPIFADQVNQTSMARPISTSYPMLSQEFSTAMQNIRTGADVQSSLDTVAERFETDIARNQ